MTALPVAGRSGEHHAVDALDQRRAGRAVARGDLEDVLREAALPHHLLHQQRAQRRDLAWLEDHAVAGGERRDAVAERVRDRVVPRPDHANEPDRRVADDELLAERDRVVPRRHPLIGQVPRRMLGPEAERGHGVAEVGELRVLVRLAALGHDHVNDPIGVVEHPLLRAAQDAAAAVEALAAQPGCAPRPRSASSSSSAAPSTGTVLRSLPGGRVLDPDRRRAVSPAPRISSVAIAIWGSQDGSSSMDSIFGGSTGRSRESVGSRSIASTASMPR